MRVVPARILVRAPAPALALELASLALGGPILETRTSDEVSALSAKPDPSPVTMNDASDASPLALSELKSKPAPQIAWLSESSASAAASASASELDLDLEQHSEPLPSMSVSAVSTPTTPLRRADASPNPNTAADPFAGLTSLPGSVFAHDMTPARLSLLEALQAASGASGMTNRERMARREPLLVPRRRKRDIKHVVDNEEHRPVELDSDSDLGVDLDLDLDLDHDAVGPVFERLPKADADADALDRSWAESTVDNAAGAGAAAAAAAAAPAAAPAPAGKASNAGKVDPVKARAERKKRQSRVNPSQPANQQYTCGNHRPFANCCQNAQSNGSSGNNCFFSFGTYDTATCSPGYTSLCCNQVNLTGGNGQYSAQGCEFGSF